MSRRISLIHHDYCPYLEERHGVRVDYAEFSMSVPQLLAIRYWAIPVTVRMIALILAEMCVDLVLYSTLRRKNHSDLHH